MTAIERDSRIARGLALASVAFAILPIAVAAARAVAGDWMAVGDNAFFEVRAKDVLTEHHPLVGTWTSASINVGKNLNNPGPLFFDLLALPTKLGGASGLAIGVALVNALAVIGIAVVVWRRAGPVGTTASMVMAAGLVWTLGSELLFDPWQPHSLLLPFLFLLTLVWAMVQDDLWTLPWIVGVASVVVQTHFSYAVLIAVLGGLSGLVALRALLRPGTRARAARVVAVSAIVGALAWIQPMIDQVDADGHGNLTTLLTSAGGSDEAVGASRAVRIAAAALTLPPFWARPSFEQTFIAGPPPALAPSAASLAVLAALLVAGVVVGRRRDTPLTAAAGLALLLVVTATATATIIPYGIFGIAAHQFRWLWPIAVFTTFAALLAVLRLATARGARTPAAAVLVALVALLSLLALPSHNPRTGPSYDADTIPTARRLLAQLGPLEGKGPLVVDVEGVRFADPYNLAVMAELQRRDVEFRFLDEGMGHQFGPSRMADGTERGRIFQRDRDNVLTPPPPGSTLVARVVGLDEDGRAERDRLRAEVATYIEETGLRLNAAGRDAWDVEDIRDFGPRDEVLRTAEPFVFTDTFAEVVRRDLITVEPAWQDRFERYAALLERWQRHTVAIYYEPTP